MGRQPLKGDVPHKPKIENPQPESIKDFVEKTFEETDEKIEGGQNPIIDQEQILQKEHEAAKDKTLGVTAVKNLAVSAGKGIASVGKDVADAVQELPPPPPHMIP